MCFRFGELWSAVFVVAFSGKKTGPKAGAIGAYRRPALLRKELKQQIENQQTTQIQAEATIDNNIP